MNVMNNDSPNDRPSDHEELPVELQALEARLASLTPRAHGIDAETLAFEAGRAAAMAQRGGMARFIWPTAFAAMATVAAALAVVVMSQSEPQVIEKYVLVEKRAVSDGTSNDEVSPDEKAPEDMPTDDVVPDTKPERTTPNQFTNSVFAWLSPFQRDYVLPQRRQIERMLAGDMNAALAEATYSTQPKGTGGVRRATPTELHWQLRNRELEGATINRPSANMPSANPFIPGANS